MTAIDDWFADLEPAQAEPLERLRGIILAARAGIEEELKWGQPCYSANRLFCYLQKAKGHVTIGFQQGAHLPDASGMLTGSGKDMRAVKIALGADVPEAAIRVLLAEALAHDAARG